MPPSRTPLPGSHRSPPPGEKAGAIDPKEQAEVSVYFKASPASGFSRANLRQDRRIQLKPAIAKLKDFATEHRLTVTLEDPARRLVKLAAPLGRLQEALPAMNAIDVSFRGNITVRRSDFSTRTRSKYPSPSTNLLYWRLFS